MTAFSLVPIVAIGLAPFVTLMLLPKRKAQRRDSDNLFRLAAVAIYAVAITGAALSQPEGKRPVPQPPAANAASLD